jgi:hypothetical protein
VKTIVAKLVSVQEDLESARDALGGGNGPAAREFSIALTSVEDAIMRTNRGFAKVKGTFLVSDVEGS